MAHIAYIDHSYHKKTLSNNFLSDMLRNRGNIIDIFWDESWNNKPAIPFNLVKNYDLVIMFQCRCSSKEKYYRKLHPNVIYIPMLDSYNIQKGPKKHKGNIWEPFQGCKIINFSTAMHAISTSFGLQSFYVKYYQQPINTLLPIDAPRGFFWLRNENHVSWSLIKTLIYNTHFESFHLHLAPDPESPEPSLPNIEDKNKFNMKTTNWFEDKQDFLNVLNNSNIYFAPRREEGIGQSFLEAMTRGQCVVAPDNGTMNEYILHGVNGLLYNQNNPEPLDFTNFLELGKMAKQSAAIGYERWLSMEDKLEEFILTPSSKLYHGYYQHVPIIPSRIRIKRNLKKIYIIRKTKRFWLPLWKFLK